MKVAIIGGGASGLSSAYFLGLAGGIQCTVYEKANYFGGNVFTAYTGAGNFERPFGDLGVNDFNTSTYRLFNIVLARLKDAGYPVGTEKLLDTTLFFTAKGQHPERAYTHDEMEHPDSDFLKCIRHDWRKFSTNLPNYLKDSTYRDMTVDEFANMKDEHDKRVFSTDFRDYNLKPRINGMYYTNGQDPGSMSIYGVMMYYHLQENIASDTKKETRHYFTHGASSWIHALTRYLKDHGCQLIGNESVTVSRDKGKWRVFREDGTSEIYDKVISAIPADQLDNVFGPDLPPEVREIASRVEYLDSTSYFHTDESVLWVDSKKWRTYNISIQDPKQKTDRPYVITYVSQMHQNTNAPVPPFVSVDPTNLDESKILQMFETPSSRDRVPAKKKLRHNTLYPVNIADQQRLDDLQGGDDLYFNCGWTVGAGLHEEVLMQSLSIAWMIHSGRVHALSPIFHPERPDHVPSHIHAFDPEYQFNHPIGPKDPPSVG